MNLAERVDTYIDELYASTRHADALPVLEEVLTAMAAIDARSPHIGIADALDKIMSRSGTYDVDTFLRGLDLA